MRKSAAPMRRVVEGDDVRVITGLGLDPVDAVVALDEDGGCECIGEAEIGTDHSCTGELRRRRVCRRIDDVRAAFVRRARGDRYRTAQLERQSQQLAVVGMT